MADRLLPDPALVERFAADLDPLATGDARLGIAVSGGPDSLALLLLARAARSGRVEAASVDHQLRPGSRAEAEMVEALCEELGVPHSILTVEWDAIPQSAIQERAREERYRQLGQWAAARGLDAIVTAHHLDDQAETFLMRLGRGAGVSGLAVMRPASLVPGTGLRLLRPLLGWRREELVALCASAELAAADDPGNRDERFERVRLRNALEETPWLDREGVARSAENLARADEALDWAAGREWDSRAIHEANQIVYRPSAPAEIRRRIVERSVVELASEGRGKALRGRELDHVCGVLESGGKATLRGVLCSGGENWTFAPAPKRQKTR